jgi:hypothetical protein
VLLLLSTALLAAATLSACGDGTTTVPPAAVSSTSTSGSTTPTAPTAPAAQSFGFSPTATREGTVQFPTGAVETLDSLTVVNGFGTAPVSATGTFTVSTLSSAAQYAAITTQAGAPLLLGWLGDAEPVINAHTTAEVYVYFAAFIYAVPDAASRTAIIASISTLSGLGTVEQAISAALVASPSVSPASNAAVAAAIKTLITSLEASSAPAAAGLKAMKALLTGRPNTLLFNPSTSASGITIVDNGQNSIQFQNTLRRGAAAYVDEVSHVDASGNIIADNAPDTAAPVTIPAVTALGSFGGSIANYLDGNFALVPILTSLQEVPNLPGAKSTTYRIAIVGPGANLGDYNNLTKVEQEMVNELFVHTLIYEVTLPLIASVAVPYAEFGEAVLNSAVVDTLVKDTINVLAASNSVTEAAESGDPEAVYTAIVAALAGNATLVEPLLQAVISACNAAATKISASSLALAEKTLVTPQQIVDAGLAVTDYVLIFKDINGADKGDLFTVVATDPTTTLTPATSSIGVSATVNLTAAVHPPQSTNVVYQFTNTAIYGHLTPTNGGAGTDNFTSTNPNVLYTANATGGGTDTITVTPQYMVTGLPNESLVPASATITVNATPPPTLTVKLATLTQSIDMPASANGLIPAETVYYIWVVPYFTFNVQAGATYYNVVSSLNAQTGVLYNDRLYPTSSPAVDNMTTYNISTLPMIADVLGFPVSPLQPSSPQSTTGSYQPDFYPPFNAAAVNFGGGMIGVLSQVALTSPMTGAGQFGGSNYVMETIDPFENGLAGGSSAEPTTAQLNAAIASLQASVLQQIAQAPASQLPTLTVVN